MIESAQDNIFDYSSQTLKQMPAITTTDPLSLALDIRRTNQQMFIPASVKSRMLGDIISSTTPTSSSTPTTSALIPIPNGTRPGDYCYPGTSNLHRGRRQC